MTEEGMITSDSKVHPLKAPYLIEVIEEGIWISLREEQS